MSGALVADLGLGPQIWLFLTLLATLTLFFKFSRFWSIRNLDLILLFAPAPGLMQLVGSGSRQPWGAFAWLFLASGLWLARCFLDLGLSRRPLLEPNLNAAGLSCAAIGLMGLLLSEAVAMPVSEGAARNPANPGSRAAVSAGSAEIDVPVQAVLRQAPLPAVLRRNPPQVIVARILSGLAHLGLCAALIAIGTQHFGRPISGLAVVGGYLVSPYTRMAVVDCGQVLPAALVATAVFLYQRPLAAGALIGMAAGWMPACLGLIPLWTGFYAGSNRWRHLAAALGVVGVCAVLGHALPVLSEWARALGARSLLEAGLLPGVENPHFGSFWTGIDSAFRLPVLIAYLALTGAVTLWPAQKNLGELIALSTALLVASQFWYLEEGGTMILLYLPLFLLMTFRPNLTSKGPPTPPRRNSTRKVPSSVVPEA